MNASSDNSTPPEAWKPLLKLFRLARRPLERFLRIQAASGILLLVAAVVAMVLANSPWAEPYHHLWELPLGLSLGESSFVKPLEWWVNDGLMVVFFFVVGMEIRREMHHGELSEPRRAALPVLAAVGGMVAPALIYLAVAGEPATRAGWGVPMATDIAFAVGVLAILGKRVPPALRVLLLALAVIDDLGAILVIALFYSEGFQPIGLLVAAAGMAGIFGAQAIGARQPLAYVPPALVVWGGFLASGIHPTIAGVLIGLSTPVRPWLGPQGFVDQVQGELNRLAPAADGSHLSPEQVGKALHQVAFARREAQSPAEQLIETLHPWVAFIIMPVFALANAGVPVSSLDLDGPGATVLTGIAAGLVLGKPLGIVLVSVVAMKLKLVVLPTGLRIHHLVVMGITAGIGFTMALFIAQLAFPQQPAALEAAKLGVLVASGIAGVVALALGYILCAVEEVAGQARTADEAESSTVA